MPSNLAKGTSAVLDASVLIEILSGSEHGIALLNRIDQCKNLIVPEFFYIEVTNGIRKLKAKRILEHWEADRAFNHLLSLRVIPYPVIPMLPNIWQLHENITPYDAAYVILAESLNLPLLTLDARLARANGHQAQIEYLGPLAQTA